MQNAKKIYLRNILSIVTAFLMIVAMIPTNVFAETYKEVEEDGSEVERTTDWSEDEVTNGTSASENWPLSPKNELRQASSAEGITVPDIKYEGTYTNNEGREVVRVSFVYSNSDALTRFRKLVVKLDDYLYEKVEWNNPKTGIYTGTQGKGGQHDKWTTDKASFHRMGVLEAGAKNCYYVDLSANKSLELGEYRLPMDFVLKENETIKDADYNILIQARIFNNDNTWVFARAGETDMSYSQYTLSTVIPKKNKDFEVFMEKDISNDLTGDNAARYFENTTSSVRYNLEKGYIEVLQRQIKIDTQPKQEDRFALRQAVDKKFFDIIEERDGYAGTVYLYGADANVYVGFGDRKTREPDEDHQVKFKKDELSLIGDIGFLQVAHDRWDTQYEYENGVKTKRTEKKPDAAFLGHGAAARSSNAGIYTVVRYYVNRDAILNAIKTDGIESYDFYTCYVRQNKDGTAIFNKTSGRERKLTKGQTINISFDKEQNRSNYLYMNIGKDGYSIEFLDSLSINKKNNTAVWTVPFDMTIKADDEITFKANNNQTTKFKMDFGSGDLLLFENPTISHQPIMYRNSGSLTGGTLISTFMKPNVDEIFTDSQKITGHSIYEGSWISVKSPENNSIKEQNVYAAARDKSNADDSGVRTEAKDVNGKKYNAFKFDTSTPNIGGWIQKNVDTDQNGNAKDLKFTMPKLERDMPISFTNTDVLTQSFPSRPDVIEQVQTKVHFDYQWDMNQGKNVVEDKIVPLSKEYKYDPETGKPNANYVPSGFEGNNVKYADENKKTVDVDGKTYQNIANHDGLAYNTNDANEKAEFMKRQFPENPDRTDEGLTLVAWSTKDPSVFANEYKQAHSAELDGKTEEEQKKIINKALIEELKANELDDADDWADKSKAYSFKKESPVVKESTVYAVYDTGATIILHSNKNDSDNFIYEIKINKNDFVNGKAIIKIPEAYYNQYDEGTFDDTTKPEFKQDKKTFAGWTLTKEDNLLLNGKLEVLNKDVENIEKKIEDKRFNFNDIKKDGTNYLPNGYSLVLEGTYEEWIKKGNIDLYAQYRDFIDVSVDKRFRTLKSDGSYSTVDDVNTDKKHSAKIGLIYRTAVTDWSEPTVHSAANYSALPKGAYGYAETLMDYNPVSDQASSNENYLADVSWKLPGFDKYGQRLSYAAVEVPIGEEDNYYNFGNDWSKLGIRTHNNLNTDTGKIEQDPNAPKDPIHTNIPLAKSQDVTLKDGNKIDTFTAATYRKAVSGKTVGPDSEVSAYEITMTNVPIEVPKPSIEPAFDGEKTITVKYYDDRVDTVQVTFPGGHEPTNIKKKTVGGVDTWTSATVNTKYLKIDSNKADKTLTFTIYPQDKNKTLHTNDKVVAKNFIGTFGSEEDEMIVQPKGGSNKVTEAEQTHNDKDGNSTIEMEIPNPTVDAPREGTKYVLVKQNADGSYPTPEEVANGTVPVVDTKEITPGTAPGAKLTFTIPKNDVKDGDKFKIVSIEPRKTPDISDIEITIDKKAEINDAKVEDSRFRIFTEITGQIAEADIPQDGKIIITINGQENKFVTNQGAIDYLNRVGLNDQDKVTFKVVDKYGNEGNATATYNKTKQLNIKVDPVRAKKSYIYLQSENGATIKITVKRQGTDLGTTTVTADGSMQKITLTTGKLQKGDVVVFEGELNGATSNPFALISR